MISFNGISGTDHSPTPEVHDDGARRRSPHPAWTHPTRQPRRQAPADLRRRGDASREEGRAFRNSFAGQGRSRSTFGRGRVASVSREPSAHRPLASVTIKTRVVRHRARFRSAPLRPISPICGARASRATARRRGCSDAGDRATPIPRPFAERCEDDRHHFRFIVSPEDAAELADLRAFTRELIGQMEKDLGTKLDWVARRSLEHRQSACPCHRARRAPTTARTWSSPATTSGEGMRARAQDLVTQELGPRSDHRHPPRAGAPGRGRALDQLDRQLVRDADRQRRHRSAPQRRPPA